MNRLEAEWLARVLSERADAELFPIVNLGSSTASFRRVRQPYIHDVLFGPLEQRGRVVHVDLKDADGVDLVGDVTDPSFLAIIRTIAPRTVVLSNVLEHVEDREALCAAAVDLVPAGGLLAVTGPHQYPHHPDPIDTGFRPTAGEAAAGFPGTIVLEGTHLDSGNWRQWEVAERGRTVRRLVLRSFVPWPRPAGWWESVRQLPWLFRHNVAFAVLLRRAHHADSPTATSAASEASSEASSVIAPLRQR